MAPRLGSRVGYEPIPVSLEVALEFLDPTNGSEVNDFIASVWKPKKAHLKIDRIKKEAEIMIGDDAVKSKKTDKKKVKSLYREASSMEITVSVIVVIIDAFSLLTESRGEKKISIGHFFFFFWSIT